MSPNKIIPSLSLEQELAIARRLCADLHLGPNLKCSFIEPMRIVTPLGTAFLTDDNQSTLVDRVTEIVHRVFVAASLELDYKETPE